MARVRRFFRQFNQVKLHQHERDAMREHLSQFINKTPIIQHHMPSLHFWQRYSLIGALAAVILCIIGVSMSVVAEDALPGELLYAVKVKFNEPLTKITAVTPESEADWQLKELDRRLTEVDRLTDRQQTSTVAVVIPQVIKKIDDLEAIHAQAVEVLKARHYKIFLASSTPATTTPVVEKHPQKKPTGDHSVKSTSTPGLIDVKGGHKVELKLPRLR